MPRNKADAVFFFARLAAFWIALTVGFWHPTVIAHEGKQPVKFQLTKLDQSAFVSLSQWHGKPVVVHFWSTDCPPCIRELPILHAYAQATQIPIIAIALEGHRDAHDFAKKHAQALVHLAAPAQPAGLLARFGNRAGVLPFTAMLTSSHTVCKSNAGEVDAKWLAAAVSHCQ